MIKLVINSLKELSVVSTTKIYKGENRINSIQVTAANMLFGEKKVSDCELYLHVVMKYGRYIVYPVTWNENSYPLTCCIPITSDITAEPQRLKLFFEVRSDNEVTGKTNSVEINVYDSPAEETNIPPREELEQTIEELETELESHNELTTMLNLLKGSYNSFPDRIAADEANITENANSSANNQAAILSLTAALGHKLSDAPSSVSSSNLVANSVTSAKIENGAVTNAKIADSAVTTGKIADGAITTDKITNSAVTTAKIADEAVSSAKLDPALKASLPVVTVWDYNTSQNNNFTVPTSCQGKLGDIIVLTTGSGTGGKIFQLEQIVSAYGTTNYYWSCDENAFVALDTRIAALESANAEYNACVALEMALNGTTMQNLNNSLESVLLGGN